MRAPLAVVVGLVLSLAAIASCGARSSLDGAAADAGTSFIPGIHPDAARLPLVDAAVVHTGVLPAPDAAPYKGDCTDPSVTYVYAVSNAGELFAFDPLSKTFSAIGVLGCPSVSHPFSMAVSRKGVAYVLYEDGELFKVSTKTAACAPTPFVPQGAFVRFGMGFATIDQGPAEELFVAATGDLGGGGLSALATIDTTTFALKPIASFVPPQVGAELTGTGDGRLFGFTADDADPFNASRVVQIDKKSAQITASVKLPGVPRGEGWAFGFWGGSFWLFTAPGGSPRLTKYDPMSGDVVEVANLPQEIVGAGVSTCAPEE